MNRTLETQPIYHLIVVMSDLQNIKPCIYKISIFTKENININIILRGKPLLYFLYLLMTFDLWYKILKLFHKAFCVLNDIHSKCRHSRSYNYILYRNTN